jgi:hypothetical protein
MASVEVDSLIVISAMDERACDPRAPTFSSDPYRNQFGPSRHVLGAFPRTAEKANHQNLLAHVAAMSNQPSDRQRPKRNGRRRNSGSDVTDTNAQETDKRLPNRQQPLRPLVTPSGIL